MVLPATKPCPGKTINSRLSQSGVPCAGAIHLISLDGVIAKRRKNKADLRFPDPRQPRMHPSRAKWNRARYEGCWAGLEKAQITAQHGDKEEENNVDSLLTQIYTEQLRCYHRDKEPSQNLLDGLKWIETAYVSSMYEVDSFDLLGGLRAVLM